MEGGGRESSIIPEFVLDSVKKSLVKTEQVKTQLLEILALADPEVLAQMPPLERAKVLFMVSKATTTLFTLRLRCSGVDPNNHAVKSELERLSLYQDKLERFIDLSKAPLRPSTTLNYQAATRFIEHSLPDLTPAQRKSMKGISRGEGTRIKYSESSVQRKRKYQSSSEKQSVQAAAKEFLEKAARELFGDNNTGLKGPLQMESSDKDDELID